MKKEEIIERYGIEAYQKQLEQARKYYKDNTEKCKERNSKWNKEHLEYRKEYYQDNKEKNKEQQRKYRKENPEKVKKYNRKFREENPEYKKEYNKTPMGRADTLVQNYKRLDENTNRGECTLTSKWIVEHIFNSQCVYCGETDWQKLGCDRIDNNLPHTPDNVVCACWDCNRERKTRPFEEFLEYKMKKG